MLHCRQSQTLFLVIALSSLVLPVSVSLADKSPQGTWGVTQVGDELQIAYGSGTDFPQYGVLHLSSSYFRLASGPSSGWGTSVILLPALWSGGQYHQGAPVVATWHVDGLDLVLAITGTIASLAAFPEVRLLPPAGDIITAQVTTRIGNSVPLDPHPGETFKPVMFSSMHISPLLWDSQQALAGGNTYALPPDGWIINPPVITQSLALRGGTSCWKINAPTMDVTLDQSMQVTGWVTPSTDPNSDNIGLWAAADTILPTYSYTLRSMLSSGPNVFCEYLPLVRK